MLTIDGAIAQTLVAVVVAVAVVQAEVVAVVVAVAREAIAVAVAVAVAAVAVEVIALTIAITIAAAPPEDQEEVTAEAVVDHRHLIIVEAVAEAHRHPIVVEALLEAEVQAAEEEDLRCPETIIVALMNINDATVVVHHILHRHRIANQRQQH